MFLFAPIVKSARETIIGTVYDDEGGENVPILFLVVRGDCAGFVFEPKGADFFEINGDGSEMEAVENAMERAKVARRAHVAAAAAGGAATAPFLVKARCN